MKTLRIIPLFLIISSFSFGQKIGDLFKGVEEVYVTQDSTKNFYYVCKPKNEIKGLLILLSGFGEAPYNTLVETDIWKKATNKGLLVVIPLLQDGIQSFYIDEDSQNSLKKVIDEVFQKYQLKGKKLYMGGFSLGGSGVVKYAQNANDNSSFHKPDAVFIIDSPLDFERLYLSMERNMTIFDKKGENEFFIKMIKEKFSGTPKEKPENYTVLSPYRMKDIEQIGVKKLLRTPIMFICEPDIQWTMKEWQLDFFGLNILDCSAFVNELVYLGNKNAILITTTNQGYRKISKKRSVHAWNIANPKNTLDWLLKY